MNIINIIKKIFIKKQVEDKNVDTNIVLFDISDIDLPLFKDLNENDKKKVLQYQKEININRLEEIIKYNQDIAKDGERLSNLLIKYLYELNEVIRKDNKTKYELEKINIDTSIKNVKILVIKEMLEDLLHNSYLKAISIERYKEEYEKKEHRFIEIFSRAARIKRNMEFKSLNETETRSKITIKTITQQLCAINNAINSNNILIDSISIYNKLLNNNNIIRKNIYKDKVKYFLEISNNLGLQFSKLNELKNILSNEMSKELEIHIINILAITEVELEHYIIDNKDKMITYYTNKLQELKNKHITYGNKNKLLEESEKLIIISKVFNEYIADEYKEEPYVIIFNILTVDINEQIDNKSPFSSYISRYNDEGKEHYKKIISEKINNLNKGIGQEIKNNKEKIGLVYWPVLLRMVNEYFKSNHTYDLENILYNKDLLFLLLSFEKPDCLSYFFKKLKYYTQMDSINGIDLHRDIFQWEDGIPLEGIYRLHEYEKEFGENSSKLKYKYKSLYELYKLINYNNNKIYLPDGLMKIEIPSLKSSHTSDKNYLKSMFKMLNKKEVVCPSSLKERNLDIDGAHYMYGFDENYFFKDISFNDGLKTISYANFKKSNIQKICLPTSVEKLQFLPSNVANLKEIWFKDYKKSKILYNLVCTENENIATTILNIFYIFR